MIPDSCCTITLPLLLAVIVLLKEKNDSRVRQMRLVLVSASRDGPIVAAAEQFLSRKGVVLPSVTVAHLANPPLIHHLWSGVRVPKGCKGRRDCYDRAFLAAKLMSEWIMIKTSPEVRRLATTLQTSPTLNVPWDWEVMLLTGDITMQERDELFARMESQECRQNEGCLFAIMKSGTGEDSWNPNCNALIDMNQQMFLDGYDFLQQ